MTTAAQAITSTNLGSWAEDAARVAPSASRIVVAVLSLQRGGILSASTQSIAESAGVARATVQRTIDRLLRHGLLAVQSAGGGRRTTTYALRVPPGARTAGGQRLVLVQPGESSTRNEPAAASKRVSSRLETSQQPTRNEPAQNAGNAVSGVISAGTDVACLKTGINTAAAAIADLLRAEKFGDGDIASILAIPEITEHRVRDAIDNAEHLARCGRLRSRRGYIASAIRGAWPLFEEVERLRRANATRVIRVRLREILRPHLWPIRRDSTPAEDRLRSVFFDDARLLALCRVRDDEMVLDDAALLDRVLERVRHGEETRNQETQDR